MQDAEDFGDQWPGIGGLDMFQDGQDGDDVEIVVFERQLGLFCKIPLLEVEGVGGSRRVGVLGNRFGFVDAVFLFEFRICQEIRVSAAADIEDSTVAEGGGG